MIKELLALRKKNKAKKPAFIRHKVHTKPRLKKVWRKPTGLHNKLRIGIKSYGKRVKPGYGSPAAVKGLSKEGLQKVLVHNSTDLNKLDATSQGAILSGKLGDKKRAMLIKAALDKKILILNLKDAEKRLKNIEERVAKKKELKAEKLKKREAKKPKEKEKVVKEEKKELSAEEKVKEEKKEKEKILTKRDK